MKSISIQKRNLRGSAIITLFVAGLLSCSGEDPTGNKRPDSIMTMGYDTSFYDDTVFLGTSSYVPSHIDCRAGLIYTLTDTIPFSQFKGTICCIDCPTTANPGDTLTFFYNNNQPRPNVTFSWYCFDGDLALVGQPKGKSATVAFGADFSGGYVQCVAADTLTICADAEYIGQ